MPVKQVFDEKDFQRRLAASEALSTGAELRLLVTGGLNAEKQFQLAQRNALMQAKKKVARAIKDEAERVRAGRKLIWTAVEVEYFGHQQTIIDPVKV